MDAKHSDHIKHTCVWHRDIKHKCATHYDADHILMINMMLITYCVNKLHVEHGRAKHADVKHIVY